MAQLYKDVDFNGNGASSNNLSNLSNLSIANKGTLPSRLSATSKQQRDTRFSIVHFAGTVEYTATGFVDKNVDDVPRDVDMLLQKSINGVISGFEPEFPASDEVSLHSDNSPLPVRKGKSSSPSVVTQFKTQLSGLMGNLNSTTPHYIRCIKPLDILTSPVGQGYQRGYQKRSQKEADEDTDAKVGFNDIRVEEQMQCSEFLICDLPLCLSAVNVGFAICQLI